MADSGRTRNETYEVIAKFYELEFASFDHDLDFYRQFAREANGPILELGAGTGRVLAGLAETGLPLVGIDNSEAMLAIAHHRLGKRATLINADMRDVSLALESTGLFWMAFSAINTFLHLPDSTAQIEALESLRSVVVSGGLLILDLFPPDPQFLTALDGRIIHEFSASLENGDRLDKWVARTHDFGTQTIEAQVWYDVTDAASAAVRRLSDQYLTRYIHRFELEHLLWRTGWRVVSLFGSYELDPFDSDSERMIVLATWGDETR